MGEAFPVEPRFTVKPSEEFFALAEPDGDGVHICISSRVKPALEELWRNTLAYSNTLKEAERLNVLDVDQAVEHSMIWLILHELHHFQMGHFKLNGGMSISETSSERAMGLVRRAARTPSLINRLPPEHRLSARRCLELQADHDSTEMLLDTYSAEGWDMLRFDAACIFAVMVLIDREDPADEGDRTHPMAATRIFQLMGYLASMWMVPAYVQAYQKGLDSPDPADFPSEEEIEAFQRDVVLPAFADAHLIARANKAPSVVEGLGDMESFMADVAASHAGDMDAAQTAGAREYNALLPINATLLQLLELETLTFDEADYSNATRVK
jgi:hypothetical protein